MIKPLSVIGVLMCISAVSAVEVKNVGVRQRRPWDNKADVTFELSGAEAGKEYGVQLVATYTGCPEGGYEARSLDREPFVTGNGAYAFTWDLEKDFPAGFVSRDFQVQVNLKPCEAGADVYLVIDLSAGPEAARYPYRYTFAAPDLSDDTCRTTELWLKRCPAGKFMMGNGDAASAFCFQSHEVTLTRPFYMGLFETTQKQWALVMGDYPSFFTNMVSRDTRPVESVSFYDIRGAGSWWPGDDHPADGKFWSPNSFVARLNARTGIDSLDLPTEAQWECACRAGTTGAVYADVPYAEFITAYGREGGWDGEFKTDDRNSDTSKGTAKVGSYPANPWGFYDFYGNVMEWVGDRSAFLDWTGQDANLVLPAVDPRYSTEADKTNWSGIVRNAGWAHNYGSGYEFSYRRTWWQINGDTGSNYVGFRICVTGK